MELILAIFCPEQLVLMGDIEVIALFPAAEVMMTRKGCWIRILHGPSRCSQRSSEGKHTQACQKISTNSLRASGL